MPTLTFYVTDDVAKQLEQVLAKRSKRSGVTVSRGDLLTPIIKALHAEEYPKKPAKPAAHYVGAVPAPAAETAVQP